MQVFLTTIPNDKANEFVRTLLMQRVIACGNILPGAKSMYWWDGEIQDEEESVIIMETTDEQAENTRKALESNHPYEVPKILMIEPKSANFDYLEWLKKEVRS